jgi:hypothetical protein
MGEGLHDAYFSPDIMRAHFEKETNESSITYAIGDLSRFYFEK